MFYIQYGYKIKNIIKYNYNNYKYYNSCKPQKKVSLLYRFT